MQPGFDLALPQLRWQVRLRSGGPTMRLAHAISWPSVPSSWLGAEGEACAGARLPLGAYINAGAGMLARMRRARGAGNQHR